MADPATAPPRGRVVDWAFDHLRESILAGFLAGGDRLSVPALAGHLGVSRSPVREAVQRLVAEGLAEEIPHRGAVVAAYDAAQLAELYEIREVLEGLAARRAADRARPELVSALTEAWERHRDAVGRSDGTAYIDEDARFHELIRAAAGNDWLDELLGRLRGRIQLAMLSTSVAGGKELAVGEHERVLAAIRRGDGDAAERSMRDHIARLRAALRESVQADD